MSSPTTQAILRVYDRDGVTLRDEVSATGVTWVDELGDEGSASYTVPFLQQALADDPALFDEAIVKVAVPLEVDGDPVEVFAWLAEPGSGTLISAEEDAGRQEQFTCRGIMALLDDWVIHHDGGLRAQGEDERWFGFMSRDFDDSGWFTAQVATSTPDPEIYPEELLLFHPEQQIISYDLVATSPVPVGEDFLARGTFTTTDPTTSVRIYATGDDYLTLYLDGELIFSSRFVGVEVTQMKAFDIDLAAGSHVIAAKVVNGRFGPPNFSTMFCLVTELDRDGVPVAVLLESDASWLTHPNTPPQGETDATILLRCLAEAEARGIDSAGRLTPTFTGSTSTEGEEWADLQERSLRVGDKGGAGVAAVLDASGAFDLDVRPDLTLNAYMNQGTDKAATITLARGVNLLTYSWRGRQVVATRLLVRSAEKWVQVQNLAAEAGLDAREHTVDAGGAATTVVGARPAQVRIGDFSRTRRTYTALMVALEGCVPYLDFGKGDIITAPNYMNEPTPMQVLSVGGQPQNEGPVLWAIELVELP